MTIVQALWRFALVAALLTIIPGRVGDLLGNLRKVYEGPDARSPVSASSAWPTLSIHSIS